MVVFDCISLFIIGLMRISRIARGLHHIIHDYPAFFGTLVGYLFRLRLLAIIT